MKKRHIFPFEKIHKEESVILVGAGTIGIEYYIQLLVSGYCKILQWVDPEDEKYRILGLDITNTIDKDVDSVKYVLATDNDTDKDRFLKWLKSLEIDDTLIICCDSNTYSDENGFILENALFPFEDIAPGKKIVLYGAGLSGRIMKKQIDTLRYVKDCLWVDLDYNRINDEFDLDVCPPVRIKDYAYDYIVIANANPRIVAEIKQTLTDDLQVSDNKIVTCPHCIYNEEDYYEKFCKPISDKSVIAIVNNQWCDNPGSVLSAFALSEFINKTFPEKRSVILNYSERKYKTYADSKRYEHRQDAYETFKEKWMFRTPEFTRLNSPFLKMGVGAAICNIDVWRPDICSDSYNSFFYFLRFLKKGAKKIAYGISFASDNAELYSPLKDNYSWNIEGFHTILSRESNVIEFLKPISENIQFDSVLDSVFLLDAEDYYPLITNSILGEKKYVYLYSLSPNDQIIDYAYRVAREKNLQIIYDLRFKENEDILKKLGYLGIASLEADPSDFLTCIYNADLVITDSFHALCFSVIFHKDVYVFDRKLNGYSISLRTKNLMGLLGLEDRYDVNQIGCKPIDYDHIEDLLCDQKKRSRDLLIKAIEDEEDRRKLPVNSKFCFGCKACEQICPVEAISLVKNEKGFYTPSVDNKLCISCGKCVSACPYCSDKSDLKTIKKCFAAVNRDKQVLHDSSSGGVFSEYAKVIIRDYHGVVYGCSMEKMVPKHVRVDNTNDIYRLRKSKYVQSEIGNTYQDVKKDLTDGKTVLFSGTPCQIAGLKLFLGYDHPRLYCIDIICHGVPSYEMFKSNIESIEASDEINIIDYYFRKRPNIESIEKYGGDKYLYYYSYVRSDGTEGYREAPYYYDKYYKDFMECKNYNDICYVCPFSRDERIGDITIGDYHWATQHHDSLREIVKGKSFSISCVLINSEKGEELINRTQNNIDYLETKFEWIAERNYNLLRPSRPLL